MGYLSRTADTILKERLEAFGAILIEGPKWCGKTTTAEQVAKSVIKLQDPDMRYEYLAAAATKPSLLLKGETPRLIDEWQDAPVLWDAVRTMVDNRSVTGQFILTGSNAVDKKKIHHSGTGRISKLDMLPMSLWESGESNGKISLMELFNNPNLDIDGIESDLSVEELVFSACRGGWPATVNIKSDKAKLLVARNYVKTVCSEDISRVDGVSRDELLTRMILRAYARNISTLSKKSTLIADVAASWCPAIRSKSAIRTGPKRAFVDPSIAVAALGLTPEALLSQLKTFGFYFEQMCIRDFKSYTLDFEPHIGHYRDRYGLEADLVLHLGDGRYALIECKLGSGEIEDGASHLVELKRLIREYNKKERQVPLREPDLMIVVTGGKIAYTRPDGVKVIPLACFKD